MPGLASLISLALFMGMDHLPPPKVHVSTPSYQGDLVKQNCANEWGHDYSMRLYCQTQERLGYTQQRQFDELASTSDVVKNIVNECRLEWPVQYQMQTYCMQKQIQSARDLGVIQ